MGRYPLVCYKHEQHLQICLTNQLLRKVVDWFHEATAHNRHYTTSQQPVFSFYHPQLSAKTQKQTLACNIVRA